MKKSLRLTMCLLLILLVGLQYGGTVSVLAAEKNHKNLAELEDAPPRLEIPLYWQLPTLPNGCEVTSLSMLLAYYGYDISNEALAETYLTQVERESAGYFDIGGNPELVYPGNPADNTGWYCFAVPLAAAANGYLAAQGSSFAAVDITGTTFAQIQQYIDAATPVVVWVTVDGAEPRYSTTAVWRLDTGALFVPYVNIHCVVVSGYTQTHVFVNDPLYGNVRMTVQQFEELYVAVGSRALILEET